MLPQKFSAATTCTVSDDPPAAVLVEFPHPASTATAVDIAGTITHRDLRTTLLHESVRAGASRRARTIA